MKRALIIITGLAFVFGIIVYATASEKMPGADPSALWNYITKVSPYKKWGFWPDHKGLQKGRAPHGPLHRVYVDDKALNSTKPPVEYGSIEVKENYDKSENLKVITVMYKVKGYNPKDGDWFWVKYMPNGKAAKFGKPKSCVGCHGTRAANDFILVHEFK